MKEKSLTTEFLKHSIHYMKLNLPRIQKCLDEHSEEEVWQRPNDASNSVGNLILHLCGNITQYIISGVGGQEDQRTRDEEFSAKGGFNKKQLLYKLEEVVREAVFVLNNLRREQLTQRYQVQGFDQTGIGIVIHVVEHFSYHVGQIAFWTKLLKSRDLGFYEGQDLNIRNKPK